MKLKKSLTGWRDLQRQVDRMVDDRWSEPVEFHPWLSARVTGTGQADPARKVVKTRGIPVTPGSQVVGESGAGGATKQVESEEWVSIQKDYLPDYLKQHDRVYLPDRDEWYEINYIPPSATYRPNVHLIRLDLGTA